jgi:hypothetical protein
VDLSIGWAYAEVVVGGELGDHVDGCFGGGALLREELIEVGASALRVHFVRSITNNTARAAHCHTRSWSELPIHAGADALAAFPGVRGAAADVLDAQ